MQAAYAPTSSNPSGAIKASWFLIIGTCAVSLIPALDFAAWLIAAPILFVTLVLGIIAMSKGATGQGIMILLATLIFAPGFIALAPIVTTTLLGAAVDSANASYQP